MRRKNAIGPVAFMYTGDMIFKEFAAFLKEYNVLALAVGFVMGGATTTLVQSFVKDVFMPIISPILNAGAWEEATFSMGAITIAYGSFLAEVINFIILGLIIFIVIRKLLRLEGVK